MKVFHDLKDKKIKIIDFINRPLLIWVYQESPHVLASKVILIQSYKNMLMR